MIRCSAVVLSVLMASSSLAGTLVVLNKSEASASLIDDATGKVIALVPTGNAPHEVAVSPDGRLAVGTNYGTREAPGSSLTVIDISSARAVKTIDLGDFKSRSSISSHGKSPPSGPRVKSRTAWTTRS
jgi:YVTN family beta-propeller protein